MAPWHTAVALYFSGWVVLYSGRAVLSPVLGTIGAEWRLDEARLGLISSVFFLAYAGMQVPTGLLADRFGKKGLLAGGVLVFAAASALRGLAPTYAWFLAAGGLAGLGQGTYYATQFALSSAAIPPRRRGLGSAVIYSGMAVGTSLGLLLGSASVSWLGWGWRTPFLVVALPAVVMAGFFVRLVGGERSDPGPRRAPVTGQATGEPVGADAGPGAAAGVPARAALTPRLLAAYLLNFTSLYAFFMLLAWLPYYLQYERGFNGPAAGLLASLVPWASIPGGLLVSSVSDRIGNRIAPLRFLLPAAAAGVFGLALAPAGPLLYGFLVLYGLTGKATTDPLLVARVAELAPPERSATALGFLNFAGMVASVTAPYVTGYLTRSLGDMRPAFYLAGAILVVGFGASLFAARDGNGSDRHSRS